MGILNFGKLLKDKAASSIVPVWSLFPPAETLQKKAQPGAAQLSFYRGKRFAVDVAPFLYKYSYYRNPDDDEKFLLKFLDLYHSLWRGGTNTVYFIFDGRASLPSKGMELEKRAIAKEQTKKRVAEKLIDLNEQEKVLDGSKLASLQEQLLSLQQQESISNNPFMPNKRAKLNDGTTANTGASVLNASVSIESDSLSVTEKDEKDEKDEKEKEEEKEKKEEKIKEIKRQMEQVEKTVKSMAPWDIQKNLTSIQESKITTERLQTPVLPVHYHNLEKVFRKYKIPYFHASGEAEFCASWMAVNGLVDIVVTDDWDAVISGSPIVLRHVSSSKEELTEIRYAEILKALSLSSDQLTDVAILAGCDFCPTLPKIAIMTGLKMVKRYGSIEKFLESNEGLQYANDKELMEKFCYKDTRKLLYVYPDTPCQIKDELPVHMAPFSP